MDEIVKVTVGMLTFNQEDYVKEAIESIFSQTYPIDEFIISDDCSTDETWEIIQKTVADCQARPNNVKHCIVRRNEKNIGFINHFNLVLSITSNIIFIENWGDDISLPDRVRTIVTDYINAGKPHYYLCHSPVQLIHNGEIWIPPIIEYNFNIKDMAWNFALHIGATQAFTTALFRDFGPIRFNDTFDDLILGFRAALTGNYRYIDTPLVKYRRKGESSKEQTPNQRISYEKDTLLQRAIDAFQFDRLDLVSLIHGYYHLLKLASNYTTKSTSTRIKSKKPKIGILTRFSITNPMFCLRLYFPLKLLEKYFDITIINSELPKDLASFDLFIIHRDYPRADTQRDIEEILKTKKPVIYEIDDNIFELEPTHVEYEQHFRSIPYIKQLLDNSSIKVLCSSDLLRKSLARRFNKLQIFVFTNHLPLSLIPNPPQRKPKDKIRIGFAGTKSHCYDLAIIESALLRIANRYGNKVEIVLWGAATENLRACDQVLIIRTPVSYWRYLQRLNDLEIDIGLIPLADNEFNRCKTDIKWVEYSALEIPAVISDIPVYHEAKSSGLGVMVSNDPAAWYNAIVDLIENPEKRHSIGQAAREYILKNRIIEKHVHKYASILNQVLEHHLCPDHPENLDLTPIYPPSEEALAIPEDHYQPWRKRRSLQEADAEILAERMLQWQYNPLITLISFARKKDFPDLAITSDALQHQLYRNWRWIVVSDQPAPDPIFTETDFLGWLQVATLDSPEACAEIINALLPDHCGYFFAVLPAGFLLDVHALLLVADQFIMNPHVAAVYCDHDYFANEKRISPHFKPDFDLDLFLATDYISPTVWFRTSDVQSLGGVRPYPNAEIYDLLLRLCETKSVAHVGEPLVSLPHSTSSQFGVSDASEEVALVRRQVLEDHLIRRNMDLKIRSGILPGTWRLESAIPLPKASVIVPIGDVFHLTAALLESILIYTNYPDWELILVDNATTDPDIALLLSEIKTQYPNVCVVRDDGPYSLPRLLTLGAAHAKGEVLTFLHQDCEVREPYWLERLVREVLRPEVGVVGPLVVRPELSEIESAGLWLGGAAETWTSHRPAFHGAHLNEIGYLGQLRLPHQVSAVSSVGLTTRLELFLHLNGFDTAFSNSDFEIDYCLRVRAAGLRVLVQPLSRLIHHGGAVIPRILTEPLAQLAHLEQKKRDAQTLFSRWGEKIAVDPFSPVHFDYGVTQPRIDLLFPLSWQRHHKERLKVLGFPVPGGSGQYRVRQPLRGLIEAGWLQAEYVPEHAPRIPSVAELLKIKPDTVLLHQRLGPAFEERISAWRKVHPQMRLVFGMDDRLDAVPRKSSLFELARRSNKDARAKLRRMLALTDAAVVSTPPLADLLSELRPDLPIYVIPNALPRELWEPHFQLRPVNRRRPRVGWVGAMQHRGDLELLIPVIEATRDEVDWVFMGMWLPEFEHLVAEKHGWVDFENYPERLSSLNLDLALAPLETNEFNEAKSNLRLLEYGAFAYPVICTDITPYRENNPPVTRLPNDPALWIEAIRSKLADRDALWQEGQQLRQWVFRHYLLEHTLPAWNAALIGSEDGQ